MKKIIVFGYPHSGTTILKSIIGHIESIEEIINECKVIDFESMKKNVLCKWPYLEKDFFGPKYKDYYKIFIVRNPLWVMSSYNRRFKNKTEWPYGHGFNEIVITLKKFIECVNSPKEKLYTIKYEDMFLNNFEGIKSILHNIGLDFNDDIFDNSKWKNNIFEDLKNVDVKECFDPINHKEFRTYQINQPFINNNEIDKITLTSNQIADIINNPTINEVYDMSIYANIEPKWNIRK